MKKTLRMLAALSALTLLTGAAEAGTPGLAGTLIAISNTINSALSAAADLYSENSGNPTPGVDVTTPASRFFLEQGKPSESKGSCRGSAYNVTLVLASDFTNNDSGNVVPFATQLQGVIFMFIPIIDEGDPPTINSWMCLTDADSYLSNNVTQIGSRTQLITPGTDEINSYLSSCIYAETSYIQDMMVNSGDPCA